MSNFITTSTATDPLGLPTGRKLLRVPSGSNVGRLALVYQESAGSISLRWADSPYDSWSSAAVMASDSADSPFDCWMNDAGDIFMVYTASATLDLQFRKLTFSPTGWSAGSAVTVYSVDDCYFPSIGLEPDNRLWISYTRFDGSDYYVNAIKSDDWGATWFVGAGETLAGPASSAYSQIVIGKRYIYVAYSLAGTTLSAKKKSYTAGLFGSEDILSSGSGLNEHFHITIADDGRVGVVFDDGQLKFREFDGSQWLAVNVVDGSGGQYPRLSYPDNNPLIVFQQAFGSSQVRTLYSQRTNGSFAVATNLVGVRDTAKSVSLYSGGAYEDLTSSAGSSASADVFHSASSALVMSQGDAMYVGQDQPFAFVKILLATAGTIGVVDWQYYDGSGWVSITPIGGAINFGALDDELRLWDDTASAPADWQMSTVNGSKRYFIRSIVTGSFTVAPIGSQITTITDVQSAITEVL